MTTLSENEKKRLRSLATAKGAKGYAAWLSDKGTNERDLAAKQATLATDTRRAAVGYGSAGATLSSKGLVNDGYAAYLRHAAKAARAAKQSAIESERGDRGAEALRGYAAYLDGERTAAAQRLLDTAKGLASGNYTAEEAKGLIAKEGDAAVRGALRDAYRPPAPTVSKEKVLAHLRSSDMPSGRAYEYCRTLGYSDAEARELVEQNEALRDENSRRLLAAFGY